MADTHDITILMNDLAKALGTRFGYQSGDLHFNMQDDGSGERYSLVLDSLVLGKSGMTRDEFYVALRLAEDILTRVVNR